MARRKDNNKPIALPVNIHVGLLIVFFFAGCMADKLATYSEKVKFIPQYPKRVVALELSLGDLAKVMKGEKDVRDIAEVKILIVEKLDNGIEVAWEDIPIEPSE